ncbi:MAG TPA: DegT/DnrJ/EryC1/StrS family aminotransferase [Actinomycetes bacterium]|nr:DegT/DnrJ/EryC1/StrS family aminotransferase [Actinomycetes bacterium]
MEGRIPPFRYSFDAADIDRITAEVRELLQAGAPLTMAGHGHALEARLCAHSRTRHAVAVASGTAALEIILRALHVHGGEVIVPTNTFGATVVAALRAGARPVFADASEDLSISVADAARKLTARTRAVITVHIGGLISPHTVELAALCAAYDVPLVEDAAHAIGASLDGTMAGGFGAAAAFSLFSTKVITSGEGGLIATNDDAIHHAALLLRDHAKDPDGAMVTTGYNWRLTEVQAIIANAQLRRLDERIAQRNEVARVYDELLADAAGISLLTPPRTVRHNRYKYVVFLQGRSPEPEALRQALLDQFGIELGGAVYRVPCHRQAAFKEFARGGFPVADRLCGAHICPPIYPALTLEQAGYVANALKTILANSPHRSASSSWGEG